MQLLSATQSAQEGPRKQAEQQLQSLYAHQDFTVALVEIARHESVPLNIRQAALLYLKQVVLAGWSDSMDDFKGQIFVSDVTKAKIRRLLLDLATTDQLDRKLKAAAGLVVSKIASADFPDEWPDLLDNLLTLIPTASDGRLHGALKVLDELIDDCFNETQFFAVAHQLIKVVHDVAVSDARKPTLRALACSVFRGCLDMLEMVLEDHKAAVKSFADEVLKQWLPFFIDIMKTRLPDPPSEQEENEDAPNAEAYRGMVALKLQVVKVRSCSRQRVVTILIMIGSYAHTFGFPRHVVATEPCSLLRDVGGAVVVTSCISSNVHNRGAPEPAGGHRRTAVYTRFPGFGGTRLHASMSPCSARARRA